MKPLISAFAAFSILITSFGNTNDLYADKQWSLGPEYGINFDDHRADYDLLGIRDVIVAVIDTGVDVDHPDLAGSVWVNEGEIPGDGIDNDNNGYIDDINGWDFYNDDNTICSYIYDEATGREVADPKDSDNHGTHVAGIIAATANNEIGIAGIGSSHVKIMVLKSLGGGTDSSPGRGTMAQTIKAIEYAQTMGADICNISWGNSTFNADLMRTIRESSMLFVTAAGNTSSDNNEAPVYPASLDLPNLISVTSSGRNGSLSDYSNYGSESIDIAAPGDHITSTIVGSYAGMSGTSMAVPHVTGLAALLYSTLTNPYPAEVKELIIKSGLPCEGLNGLIRYPVIPDAAAALEHIGELANDTAAPDFTVRTIYDGSVFKVTVDAYDPIYSDTGAVSAASGIRVIKHLYGNKKARAFHKGTVGISAEDGVALLSKAGTYTFYVSDYAGNETIKTFTVEEKNATGLSLPYSRKTMLSGETYQIKYSLEPFDSTDPVFFESSDPDIISVDEDGILTAHSMGHVVIRVFTNEGLSSELKLFVRR